MTSLNNIQLRRVNRVRFVLPLFLFVIVVVYEKLEHWFIEDVIGYDFSMNLEIVFFGILGPIAIFFVLSYVVALLTKQMAFAVDLRALNKTLEQKVTQRTKELATRNAELQKLDQFKSDFVSLVSHELRGPMTTLKGGLEMALQEADMLAPKTRHILQVMNRESHRLSFFVQTILDVSRMESGKLVLAQGLVAVFPLLHHAVDVLFVDGKRQIDWKVPKSLPPLWADETYLEKAISNLLTNADKYSPPNLPIELSVTLEEDHIKITVTDYGPGIPLEMQARIFDRFQRLERGDLIKTKGWGLGLYFSKVLTEAQGGQLSVRSPVRDDEEAPGTAFSISMPLALEIPEDI